MSEPTIFLVRPYRNGWQCFETPGVQPYWRGDKAKEHAISYARNCRTANRHGEIRILNAGGKFEESIAFDERANRMRSNKHHAVVFYMIYINRDFVQAMASEPNECYFASLLRGNAVIISRG